MTARSPGLFARRGIHLPGAKVTAVAVLVAFVLGLVVGWLSTQLPSWVEARNAPAPSPSPSAEPSPEPEVSVPPLSIITRAFTEDDELAGLSSLEYPYEGDGTMSVVAGHTNPLRDGVPIRYVSIEVEDGININPRTFATYIMAILNDQRGWGANNRVQYVRTDGAADLRIAIASPYTAAKMCPDVHAVGPEPGGVAVEPSASPSGEVSLADAEVGDDMVSPEASEAPEDTDESCAWQGLTVLSVYDWAAGVPAFEDDVAARVYLVQHAVGHLRGEADVECRRGRASVMVDHTQLPESCEPNPWPFPDAVDPDDPGDS